VIFVPGSYGTEGGLVMDEIVSRVRLSGPLAEHGEGFAVFLAAAGYSPLSAANQMRVLAHLSRWLGELGLAAGALTAERAAEFAAGRRAAGYVQWTSERGLGPVLEFLRGEGAAPAPAAPVQGPVDVLVERYRGYLASERGLAAGTVGRNAAYARLFLTGREESLPALTAAEVSGFVLAECRRRSTGSAKLLVTALRSVLRFLAAEGLAPPGLEAAAPAVAGRRDTGLPRALPAGQVAALLASCDREAAAGLRDFAVLTLLSRLGLRAGEVAALELGDIGWRAGELLVRGKGRREERLPLPADAGQALAAYLHGARPCGTGMRAVFLAARAPLRPMSANAVKMAVRTACARAGLPPAGPHRLRHTVGTAILQAGAPLEEVGQVLRHRSAATTAIYAKVDRGALGAFAAPWPGGAA
jgi:integrase/recombinase XerD